MQRLLKTSSRLNHLSTAKVNSARITFTSSSASESKVWLYLVTIVADICGCKGGVLCEQCIAVRYLEGMHEGM